MSEEVMTQGQEMVATLVGDGIQTAVVGYIQTAEVVLTGVLKAAENLLEDGFGLEEFILMLKGEDVS